MAPILRVRNLSVGLVGRRRTTELLSSVDLDVLPGEILGLVGESGCGKSTLAAAILRLVERPVLLQSGSAHLTVQGQDSCDLLAASPDQLRSVRWRQISYIPQGSMCALNPVLRVRKQMTDTLIEHGSPAQEADAQASEALRLVNLRPAVLDRYPHELSGGMSQRVVIAMAMSMLPPMVIADEPTTALDVVTQRLILQELTTIRKTTGATFMLISHDMGVMAETVDRMAVMYAGRIVELSPVGAAFAEPLHPYSSGLIGSIPRLGQRVEGLSGKSPTPWDYPPGCRFHPRCPHAMDVCEKRVPVFREHQAGRWAACHLYGE